MYVRIPETIIFTPHPPLSSSFVRLYELLQLKGEKCLDEAISTRTARSNTYRSDLMSGENEG